MGEWSESHADGHRFESWAGKHLHRKSAQPSFQMEKFSVICKYQISHYYMGENAYRESDLNYLK